MTELESNRSITHNQNQQKQKQQQKIINKNDEQQIKAYDAKLDLESIPVPKSMRELCASLHDVFDGEVVNVDYVSQLMSNYKSNAKDWRTYSKYDPHKYTRNLVDEGNGKFNVMLLCWAESQGSSIHDHSNSHCFMKCLDGELVETKFDWPGQKVDDDEGSENNSGEDFSLSSNSDSEHRVAHEMTEKQRTLLKKNDVCYINDEIGLHRVENPSHSKPAVTLHVYVPGYKECRGFDQNTGLSRQCQVTFYSKFGSKCAE